MFGVNDCKSFLLFLLSFEWKRDDRELVFFIGKGKVDDRLVIVFFLNVIFFIKLFIVEVCGVRSW